MCHDFHRHQFIGVLLDIVHFLSYSCVLSNSTPDDRLEVIASTCSLEVGSGQSVNCCHMVPLASIFTPI